MPALVDYIAIPAKSPMFDADWREHGHIERVIRDAAAWVEGKKVAGLKLEIIRLEGRTPLIFFEVPSTRSGCADTVCMYGHLDKQPEFSGWRKRSRALDAEARGRAALWPRRCRRRLCDLRRSHFDPRAGPPGHRPAARRRHLRDLRGKRQRRPAGLHRSADATPGQREPRRLPRLGRRQLRPALAHDEPARHGQRRVAGRDPDRRRPLRRRERPRAVELSHPAPGARPARGLEDGPPAAGRAFTAQFPPTASSRRARQRRSSATRSGSASPGPAAPTARRACRPPPIPSRPC